MNQTWIQENISQNLLCILKHPNIQVTSSNKGPLNWNGKLIFSLIWGLHCVTIMEPLYYTASILTSILTRDRFLALRNFTLKLISEKTYSKLQIILEVNNALVVETWMTKRCIADYTNTSLHGFAYFVPHPFKRPLIVGKKSNLFYF